MNDSGFDNQQNLTLDPFDQVLDAVRAGEMVVMVDDAARENEGDLVIPTATIKPAHVSAMMRNARGLICVSISGAQSRRLRLPPQALQNDSVYSTPFAVSVDHISVKSKGAYASSRLLTMQRLIAEDSQPSEFVSPGFVVPLIAHPLGVLGRQGQTEGSLDLARLAGFAASGVICEILNQDGSMARGKDLQQFAAQHGLKVTSVDDVIRYRIKNETVVRQTALSNISTDFGIFDAAVFEEDLERKEHLALSYGDIRSDNEQPPLVRLHSECLTGDVFSSRRCDCGPQLNQAMHLIAAEKRGVVLYLRQEGRGIGLVNKLKAYKLQDEGHDTVEANLKLGFDADKRDFAVAASMLKAMEIRRIRLLTNNPKKQEALERHGIAVIERLPLIVPADEESRAYLETKRTKLGHIF